MINIINNDCLVALKALPDNSVDSVVTDPPYGISFMGKKWDYDVPSVDVWKEVFRVLKHGGHILCACGTRTQHRMTVNIEDAGFEIRDVVAWIYGSGFPKSLDVSKSIEAKVTTGSANKDQFKNLDGEKGITQLGYTATHASNDRPNDYNNQEYNKRVYLHTNEAKQWDGWGTALKPACEYWTLAYKPFSIFKKYGIFAIVNNTLLDLIWQSLGNLQEEDTSNLLEMVLIPLNTALLWHSILEEVSIRESKFTTSMELKLITELKILNSLLSKNTQESTDGRSPIYQNGMSESQVSGFNALVTTAERVLEGLNHIKNDSEITRFIVTEIASLKEKNTCSFVPSAESNLRTLNENVSFVLQRVLTSLITEENNSRLNILVNYAEKLLQQSLQENPSIAAGNVWQKHLENIQPKLTLWTLARKPLSEKTVAENVLKYGTGGINIDGCRVETEDKLGGGMVSMGRPKVSEGWDRPWMHDNDVTERKKIESAEKVALAEQLGRFPANVIHDGSEEVVVQFPTSSTTGFRSKPHQKHEAKNTPFTMGNPLAEYTDSGSSSRFFYCAKASKSERNKGLDGFDKKEGGMRSETSGQHLTRRDGGDPDPVANYHPTVKPVALMRYLCRLITPPKGIVLDPFMGSGTTGIGAKTEGFSFIGIERESDYCKIAKARINAWEEDKPKEIVNEPTLF